MNKLLVIALGLLIIIVFAEGAYLFYGRSKPATKPVPALPASQGMLQTTLEEEWKPVLDRYQYYRFFTQSSYLVLNFQGTIRSVTDKGVTLAINGKNIALVTQNPQRPILYYSYEASQGAGLKRVPQEALRIGDEVEVAARLLLPPNKAELEIQSISRLNHVKK